MLSLEAQTPLRRLRARRRARGRARLPCARRARRVPASRRSCGSAPAWCARRGAGCAATAKCGSTPSAEPGVDPEERSCGYVFQEYALFPHLTRLAERRLRHARRSRARAAPRAAEALLERFGLAERWRRPARELCRAASASGWPLARALAPAAPACCCWTSRWRRSTRDQRGGRGRELAAALRDAGVPALLVTHDFAQAAQLGDEVAVIDRGRLVQRGTGRPSSPPRPRRRSWPTSPAPACLPVRRGRATGRPHARWRSTAAGPWSARTGAGPDRCQRVPVGGDARACRTRRITARPRTACAATVVSLTPVGEPACGSA